MGSPSCVRTHGGEGTPSWFRRRLIEKPFDSPRKTRADRLDPWEKRTHPDRAVGVEDRDEFGLPCKRSLPTSSSFVGGVAPQIEHKVATDALRQRLSIRKLFGRALVEPKLLTHDDLKPPLPITTRNIFSSALPARKGS
jgi:hypothetical protein